MIHSFIHPFIHSNNYLGTTTWPGAVLEHCGYEVNKTEAWPL